MHDIEDRRFLVTGGAGFIGSHIVDDLLEHGAAEVRVLDNFVRGSLANLDQARGSGRLSIIRGDIRDASLVDEVTKGVDYIFHQSALRITRCAEAPREAVDVLIGGTLNVLESAVRHNIKKVVAASSASVYGDPSYLPMDEAHPFNNRTLYGAGKIANEQMFRAFNEQYGLSYVAFRYFNVYGPRMDLTGVYTEVLVRWLDAVETGAAPLIFGDGLQSMDFVYVKDVSRANILAMQSDVSDEVFNVGTGQQTTLNELCAAVLHATGSSLQPEHREARKVANVRSREAATEKAEKMLGFRSSVALQEGLRNFIDWRCTQKSGLESSSELAMAMESRA
jgi:UDP-glucose 4-epimerase